MNRSKRTALVATLVLAFFGTGTVPLRADVEHLIATGVNTYLDLDLKSNNQPGVAYGFFDSFHGRNVTRVQEVGATFRDMGIGENHGGGYYLGPHFAYSPQTDVPSVLYHAFSNLISSSRRKLQFEGQTAPGSVTAGLTVSDMAARDMALGFDTGGRAHMVFDLLNASFDYERWHAFWDGSQWVQTKIENPPLRVQLAKMSMAADPLAGDVYAAYVVRPGGATTPSTPTELILRRFSATGGALGRAVIDSGGPRDVPGEVSSVAVDRQGKVHLAYTFEDDQRGTWLLKYFLGGTQGGTVETIEQDFWPADFHTGVALALDTAGQPYIAYTFIDQSTNEQRLRVVKRVGPGNWVPLDPVTQSNGVLDVDMAIGTDNVLQVAYMDASDETIKLVQRPLDAGCKINVTARSQNDTAWDWHHYDTRYEKDRNGNLLRDANGDLIPGTINRYGCALTSLAMSLDAAGAHVDPGSLNSFMKQKGGFSGEYVDWKTTVETVSRDLYQNTLSLKWFGSSASSRADLAAAEQELEDIVCRKGHPVIVGVKLRPNPDLGYILPGVPVLGPGHFVLVVGKEGNRFTIIDPEHTDPQFDSPLITYLDHYYVDGGPSVNPYLGGFEIRGYVADPPGISGLDLAATDVNLLLSDSFGNRTGLDLASGEKHLEIPLSLHYLDALEDDETEEPPLGSVQLLYITRPPEGTYLLVATPLRNGPFQVTLRGASRDGSEQPSVVLAGQASAGETRRYRIVFSETPGATLQTFLCKLSLQAPPDLQAHTDPGSATARLDPGQAAATDNCGGTRIRITALRDDGLALSEPYPIGTTEITWTATDDAGNTSSARQTILVHDSEHPVLRGVSSDRTILWPPNHQMIEVTVRYAAEDNSGAPPPCTLSVTSNEPQQGTEDGDASPDWIVVDAHRVRLRAERSGRGSGRLYNLTVTCADAAGNASAETVIVNVPKNRAAHQRVSSER